MSSKNNNNLNWFLHSAFLLKALYTTCLIQSFIQVLFSMLLSAFYVTCIYILPWRHILIYVCNFRFKIYRIIPQKQKCKGKRRMSSSSNQSMSQSINQSIKALFETCRLPCSEIGVVCSKGARISRTVCLNWEG